MSEKKPQVGTVGRNSRTNLVCGYEPKTFIGLHFLKNERVMTEILNSIPEDNNCLEIGAGPATLTTRILQRDHRLISYEID